MEGNAHKYVAKGGSRDSSCRRALHGARGLKLKGKRVYVRYRESRPTRGAWIETRIVQPAPTLDNVAPYTGRVD